MSKVTQVDFVPKEMVSYSKETQTPTEAMTHTDQKAGKTLVPLNFTSKCIRTNRNGILCVPEEEEDEELSAPPTVDDSQEDKGEQGDQQEEGKDKDCNHFQQTTSELLIRHRPAASQTLPKS